MKNNYDTIAWGYDTLSRLVFFRTQVRAQIDQLRFIPANSTILIAGGGTGWILEEIAKIHLSGLKITYIELSEKMLGRAEKRHVGANEVTFIHAAAEDFKSAGHYDVILTAFLFDNFSEKGAEQLFHQLHQLLRQEGVWLFADFYYNQSAGKNWKWYLLKTMYLFFNKISKVEAKELVNTEMYFGQELYVTLTINYYYNSFIKAIVYKKIN